MIPNLDDLDNKQLLRWHQHFLTLAQYAHHRQVINRCRIDGIHGMEDAYLSINNDLYKTLPEEVQFRGEV